MLFNPFNPQQPARPDFFVGREPEIIEFEKYLNQTIHNSPMNMSISGNRGMGKTSLLVKFEEIAKENHCLTIRLSNYEGNINTIIDFVEYLTSNLKREFLSRRPIESGMDGLQEWLHSLKITLGWNEVSLSVEKKQLVQEVFRQTLLKFWDKAKKDYPAIVVLFDEAESLEKIDGVLTFLREVFQRVSTEANYMLILAGKLNFPERMSESFSPLNRFFPGFILKPFEAEEIVTYINKKLNSVNISIDQESLNFICRKSEGHPYVLVAMCYLLFDSLAEGENQINLNLINRAEEKIYAKLAQDFFSPMYHPLTPKAKEVLQKITRNVTDLNFTFSEAVTWTKRERNYVSPYILELWRKGIINKLERGKYKLFHRLFLDYVEKIDSA